MEQATQKVDYMTQEYINSAKLMYGQLVRLCDTLLAILMNPNIPKSNDGLAGAIETIRERMVKINEACKNVYEMTFDFCAVRLASNRGNRTTSQIMEQAENLTQNNAGFKEMKSVRDAAAVKFKAVLDAVVALH